MKRVIIFAVLIISGVTSSFGQVTARDEKTEAEVMNLVKEFTDVLVSRDARVAERILAPEYMDPCNGLPLNRFLLLRSFKEGWTGWSQVQSITLDDNWRFVHIYGDTAVAIVKTDLKWKVSKEVAQKTGYFWPVADSNIVTYVAVRTNGKWQLVSTQASRFDVVVRELKTDTR